MTSLFCCCFVSTSDHDITTSSNFDIKKVDLPHEKEPKSESNHYRILRRNLVNLTGHNLVHICDILITTM